MKKTESGIESENVFCMDLNHKYLFFRRTKIIATIGPASSSPEKIRQLISKGLNVARINFSHGNPEDHLRTIQTIRKISKTLNKPLAILGDLCGPKIRVGKFRNDEVLLKEKSTVVITTDAVLGDEKNIPSQYKNLVKEVSVGDQILLDDGNLELKVMKKTGSSIEALVVRGGLLKNNKGMNLPDTKMNISALTAKDKKDVAYCIKGQVDYIALSFVRKPEDVLELKKLLQRNKADIPVIAKIEKPEALENIHGIMQVADSIMIARGDLGVELPAKKVPLIQNKLIEIASQYNKPVIVATQMLESMIEHSRPTRAEVTDVVAACLASADAVMLSGETASGKYPIETFEMMDSILREAEAHQFFANGGLFRDSLQTRSNKVQNALGIAIAQLSRDLMVRCIFVPSRSGNTARIISSDRPAAPIIALTSSEKVFRRLQLLWGVFPHYSDRTLDVDEARSYGESLMKKMDLAKNGDFILMLSTSDEEGKPGTDSISVHQIS